MTDVGHTETLLEQEEKTSLAAREFGFWVYLMTDAVIFALLFATYVVLSRNSASGQTSNELFDLRHTAGETALLLTSSLTFGFAAVAQRAGQKIREVQWLIVTLFLGLGFLGMEMAEFRGMIVKGAGPEVSGFLSAFFTLIGTHGLHVAFGCLGIVFMIGQILVKGLTQPVRSRVFRLGLFWHFLDIVWIGIFSIVYLPGVM